MHFTEIERFDPHKCARATHGEQTRAMVKEHRVEHPMERHYFYGVCTWHVRPRVKLVDARREE